MGWEDTRALARESYGAMLCCEGLIRPVTIMNRAIHIAIVLAVAVHMVFGCCSHHAHASGPGDVLPLSLGATCPCENHGHQHENQPFDHDSNHHGCDEGPCTFTRPDSSELGNSVGNLQCLPLISCEPLLPTLSAIEAANLAPSYFG